MIFGIVGGIIASIILTIYRVPPRYKCISMVLIMSSIITVILIDFSIIKKNFVILFIFTGLNGFTVISLISVGYELSVDLSFGKVGEGMAVGI